jgi:hypothetical protein
MTDDRSGKEDMMDLGGRRVGYWVSFESVHNGSYRDFGVDFNVVRILVTLYIMSLLIAYLMYSG